MSQYRYADVIAQTTNRLRNHVKDVFGITANLQVFNMTDGRLYSNRTVYTGQRNASPALFVKDHDLSVEPIFRLELTGSF